MSHVNPYTGNYEGRIVAALMNWTDQNNGIAFGANVGFYLPNKAMRAPDAAWMSDEKWNSHSNEAKKKFLKEVPELVVEIVSPSDHPRVVADKMTEWINNGALLAWFVDPEKQVARVYREDGSMEEITDFEKGTLRGEDLLPGFEFELSRLYGRKP